MKRVESWKKLGPIIYDPRLTSNKNGMFIIVTFEIRKWNHFFILMCCNHFRSSVNAIQSEIMSSSDEDYPIKGKAFQLYKKQIETKL